MFGSGCYSSWTHHPQIQWWTHPMLRRIQPFGSQSSQCRLLGQWGKLGSKRMVSKQEKELTLRHVEKPKETNMRRSICLWWVSGIEMTWIPESCPWGSMSHWFGWVGYTCLGRRSWTRAGNETRRKVETEKVFTTNSLGGKWRRTITWDMKSIIS